jgi:hypothetical protein
MRKQDLIAMPKENDLEGAQDQGGKHGGQGMAKPEPRPPGGNDQGIVRDERGQGSISHVSPLARAMLGKAVGDVIRAGKDEAEITSIV